jgi:16S rRNA C1402 (ribose-2'-O) methylase RsmI
VLGQLGEPKGEFTVVVAGRQNVELDAEQQVPDNQLLMEFGRLTETGLSRREALGELARRHKLRSREVFAAIDRARRP